MQFIEELTIVQQAAIGGALILVSLLALIGLHRRRSAGADASTSGQVKAKRGRKHRSGADAAKPRRKRRKLAAEAAHAMNTELPTGVPQVPEVPLEPATAAFDVTEALDDADEALFDEDEDDDLSIELDVPAVPAPAMETAAPIAHHDDPYLQSPVLDASGAVAQPGWPTPGELATTFDPDAFDPMPEFTAADELEEIIEDYQETAVAESAHPLFDDEIDEFSVPAPQADEAPAEPVAAGPWDDADAVEWDDDDLTVSSGWTNSTVETPALVDDAHDIIGEQMETDQIWGEPDHDSAWGEDVALDVPVEAHATAPTDDWQAPDAVVWDTNPDVPVVPAVPTALTELFPSPDATVPEVQAPAVVPAELWSGSVGTAGSNPVVLDLAGLAASGQSLELVIEPNADGNGVRLRFGRPAESSDVVAPEPQNEVTPLSTPNDIALAVFAPDPAPTQEHDPAPEGVAAEPGDGDTVVVAVESEQEVPAAAPEYTDGTVTVADADDFEESVDDPARILADIRARLAELDAAR